MKNKIPPVIYRIYLHGMIYTIWIGIIHNTDWTSELPRRVMYIVLAGHTLNSYSQFIHAIHRFKSYALFISLIHPPVPYAQIIRPSHTPKPYAQIIRPSHTLKPYARIITTVVLWSYCVQSSHSEMVRLKKECIYNKKSSIKGNYAKLDVTRRFEFVEWFV